MYFLIDYHLNILKISSIILKLCCEIIHEGHKVCCDGRNKSCCGIISCPLGCHSLLQLSYRTFRNKASVMYQHSMLLNSKLVIINNVDNRGLIIN